MDEQLREFLDQWETTRVAQLHKYELSAKYWKEKSGVVWSTAERKVKHYKHELAMLRELRARSLP